MGEGALAGLGEVGRVRDGSDHDGHRFDRPPTPKLMVDAGPLLQGSMSCILHSLASFCQSENIIRTLMKYPSAADA